MSRAAHPESVGARRLPRGIVRRVGWSLADQVVSSGTNFAVGLILARSLSIEDFGAFSLAFFIYAFAISLARAYPLDPLLIRYSVASPEKWRRGAAAAVGTSTGVACVAAIGLIAVGVLVGGPMGAALLALGATLPGLLTQDAWRVAFFAAGRARSAFINDVVWALFLVPAFALAGLAGASLFAIMLAWGLAASIAALFGVAQTRVVPRPDHALAWWREHDDLAARFLLETGLRTGLGQLVMIAIGAIAGLAAIGSIRAAQLVMAPVQVLYLGASMAATPEAVRALDKSLGALLRMGAGASLGLALACLTWGGIALLIPDELGRRCSGIRGTRRGSTCQHPSSPSSERPDHRSWHVSSRLRECPAQPQGDCADFGVRGGSTGDWRIHGGSRRSLGARVGLARGSRDLVARPAVGDPHVAASRASPRAAPGLTQVTIQVAGRCPGSPHGPSDGTNDGHPLPGGPWPDRLPSARLARPTPFSGPTK